MSNNYLPIIGLEVHVELKTQSKMFCGCSANYFGHEPNTHCCPVCLGLPGALPVPNKKAVEWCLLVGMALSCKIPELSKFDRKNYFYPDLPKGYQISQYDEPLCIKGFLNANKLRDSSPSAQNDNRVIRIRRVHMEEDTGKLLHTDEGTLIDFNRSGVPLVEIITEPDIHSAEEAKLYVQKIQQIIRYLGVSDADMEKGSMRLEPNISIKKLGTDSPGVNGLPDYKVEVKNINSFKFVERAIDYEIRRQTELLERGESVKQETRGWSEKQNATLPQRSKEEAKDYRYFPEPDIPPIRLGKNQILEIKSKIPELPDAKLARFMKEYGLGEYDANILVTSLPVADYFEESIKYKQSFSSNQVLSIKGKEITPKTIANLIINKKVDIHKTAPKEFIKMISAKSPAGGLTDEELGKVVKSVIEANPKAISDYKSGKEQALMFLVGQVLRETKEQANPEKVKKLLMEEL